MSEQMKPAIAILQTELKEQEQQVIETKKLINSLCKRSGMPPMYADAELTVSGGVPLSIRSDQFYGQPLAGSIREILQMRRALNQGPATVNEIYDSLHEGGFKFETKNEDNSKRGLRISLMKNTAVFHKLPNGKFGLLEWYPNVKAAKPKADVDADAEADAGDEENKP
jgi:hypothetical protein